MQAGLRSLRNPFGKWSLREQSITISARRKPMEKLRIADLPQFDTTSPRLQ